MDYAFAKALSRCTYPPSTCINCPVVWLDLEDNKNAVVVAISSAVVMRCSSGIFFTIDSNFSTGLGNVAIHFLYKGVQHSATTIPFTRIRYFNNSIAHSRVNALRPSLKQP